MKPIMLAAMVVILILFCFPCNAAAHLLRSFKAIRLPTHGSEAYAFDSNNAGTYTGLNDCRIVKYLGSKVDFATTSPNRSKKFCDGKNGVDPKIGPICGRPIGLEFNHKSGDLYIIDAFKGLLVVGNGGGAAARIGVGKDGVFFDAPDAIAIDPISGVVYYTDVGTIFFKTKY